MVKCLIKDTRTYTNSKFLILTQFMQKLNLSIKTTTILAAIFQKLNKLNCKYIHTSKMCGDAI